MSDAPDIQRLAGDKDVASTTKGIKHPYEDGMAEEWITSCQRQADSRELVHFAITVDPDDVLIGVATLHLEGKGAELSYWIGKPFWNQGYASEAAKAVVEYGFSELALDRIYAAHFTRNPASGRVLVNAGMHYEGSQLGPTIKWGNMEQLELYGVSWEQSSEGGSTSSPPA